MTKLLFTTEWLQKTIEGDPDIEADAGWPLTGPESTAEVDYKKMAVIPERNVVQIRIALGTLVHQLRQRDQLTLQQLATRADVSEDELRQVETNPTYTARPRMIYQLSQYFGVSLNNLYQMSGSTHTVERQLYNEAVKYAAHSDALSPLTEAQQQVLDSFVAILNQRAELKAGD